MKPINNKLRPRGTWVSTGENPFLVWRTYQCVVCKEIANKLTPLNTKTCSDLCSRKLALELRRKCSKKRNSNPTYKERRRIEEKIKYYQKKLKALLYSSK